MGKILAVTIQKGGVGKSTTVLEIGVNLANLGNKVLLIDLDPQQNLSRMAGGDFEMVSIYDVLSGDIDAENAVQSVQKCDIIIADKQLKFADRDFAGERDLFRLSAALSYLKGVYDYIIIDTPPSLGVLPSMALTAADGCVVPCEATANGAQGLGQLSDSIREIREKYNPNLKILGVLLTQYTWRTTFNRVMRDQIQEYAEAMGSKLFETHIRTAVVVQEAQGFGQSVTEYSPKSKPAQDYLELTKEILKELN